MMKVEYEWVPNLRSKAIADDGREFDNLLNMVAFEYLDTQKNWMETGIIDCRQCRGLWKWLGRTDKPPKRLTLFVNRADIMRLFPLPGDKEEEASGH